MSRSQPLVGRLALMVALIIGLVGCSAAESGSPSPGAATRPTLGAASTASAVELAALKRAAGIEPCPATGPARSVEGGLPALTLPCLGGGRPVNLSALGGTPMVLNVWAQWCGPCREEIPLFQRLHEQSDGRLQVIGVDVEDPQEGMALAFAAEVGMTYPQLQDLDRELLDALQIRGVPLTLFVGADGRVERIHPAPAASSDELTDLVAEHLGVSLR